MAQLPDQTYLVIEQSKLALWCEWQKRVGWDNRWGLKRVILAVTKNMNSCLCPWALLGPCILK